MALLVKRDQIEYMKTRAVVQSIVNHEEAQKALEGYRDIQFPYLANIRKSEHQEHIDKLKKEVARGPMVIRAFPEKKMKSKLKSRLNDKMTPEQRAISKRLSTKLGRLM